MLDGLVQLQQAHPELVTGVGGMPEMCFLQYADEAASRAVTAACARAGLLFKRSAYNFVSLAHDEPVIDRDARIACRSPLDRGKTCLDWENGPVGPNRRG